MGQVAAVLAAMLLVVCVHADQVVSRDRQLQVVPLLGSSVTTGQGILGHLQLWSTVTGGDNEGFVSVCDLPTNPTWNNAAAQVSCKAFGYPVGVALLGPAAAYATPITNVTCSGSEKDLISCTSQQAAEQQTCHAAVIACTGRATAARVLSPGQLVAIAVGATLGGVALLGIAAWGLARAWQQRQHQQQHLGQPVSRNRRRKHGAAASSAAAEEAAAIAHVVVGGGRRTSLEKPRQAAGLPASTIPGSSGRLGATSIDVSAAVMAAQRAASMSARQPSNINRQHSVGKEGSAHRVKQRDGSSSGSGSSTHTSKLLHHHLQQQQHYGSSSSHRRTSESNSSRGSGYSAPLHKRRTSWDSSCSKGTTGRTSDPGHPTGVSQVTHGDRVAARAARLAASWNAPASEGDSEEQQHQQQQQGALLFIGGAAARAAHIPEAIPEESSRPPSQRSSVHLPQGASPRSPRPAARAAARYTAELE